MLILSDTDFNQIIIMFVMKTELLVSLLCVTLSVSAAERLAANCRQGWTSYQDNCYQLFKYQYSWNNAEFLCENVGSSLASAHDVAEYSFLQNMTKTAGFTTAWLGGYRFQGYWKWEDGTPFDYNNWQTPSTSYRYDCLHLNSDGTQGWGNQECTHGKPFICSL